MTMTPEQRAEWRALADAATEGPWEDADGIVYRARQGRALAELLGTGRSENAAFIAAAREAVLALLDALDAAEAEVERLTEKAARLQEIVATRPPLDYRAAEARLAR
jgi:hypothetical protein